MKATHEQINVLLDFYEVLLTDKQRYIMSHYYREDYSLGEIAQNLNISRSAVQDVTKKCSILLQNYESKLHLVKKYKKRLQLFDILDTFEDTRSIDLKRKLIEHEEESYE